MADIGKRVVDELYVHVSALEALDDEGQRAAIQACLRGLPEPREVSPNVAKLNLRTGRLSLLAYPEFDVEPFPRLLASWAFEPGSSMPTYRSYSQSLNPPILHRKELLVSHQHQYRDQWAELSKTAEELGLFDDTTTIGFQVNWERLVASKGYRLVNGGFVPLGNVVEERDPSASCSEDEPIRRYLTALSRSNLSAPMQLLVRHGLISSETSVFDYGCGRGDDVAGLVATGVNARGWDPHFAADQPIQEADVVNLGFVVNVIEDPAERVDAIQRAFKLARRVIAISVMLYGNDPSGRPFNDGYRSTRGTFQKYFTQAELKDYVEHVLQQQPLMVGPGVAFVFTDGTCEQRFIASRYRSRGVARRLLGLRLRVPRPERTLTRQAKTPSRSEREWNDAKPYLDKLWANALDLGRFPEPDEITNLHDIELHAGGLRKARRLIEQHYDGSLLASAAATRADDVRLLLSSLQFSRRPAYRSLEQRLQRDIKTFFGNYVSAENEALQLLRDAADPSRIFEACEKASAQGLGWLEGQHSLQLHISMVDRLPVLLRAYVSCGLLLWDAVSDVQLVKIHIASGKLTLMEFEDFDGSPLPRMNRRIKVNLRGLDYDVFEYGTSEYPKPLLYRKSRFIDEEYTTYAEQLAFDQSLEATGLISDIDFGPSEAELERLLSARRLAVKDMTLGRSDRIPSLDEVCGANFTYRSFVECGETQKQLRIPNRPLKPATFNAIYDLATQVLDPVIDYFGAIRLTYGFCSPELGRHIARGVAPRLDQHAAHELGKNGKLICERGGAACDFIVDDEDMYEVADWIIANLKFDRLYIYGKDRPLHVSLAIPAVREVFAMETSPTGRRIPRRYGPT